MINLLASKITDGLLVFLIGNLVVVAALAFLVIVVMGYSGLLNKILDRKKTVKPVEQKSAPVAAPAPKAQASNDTEVVAAITAAITAIYESENNGQAPQFTIKNVTPVQSAEKEVAPFRVKRIY